MAANSTANDNDGWVTTSDESPLQVKFDTFGDTFTGIKSGKMELTGSDGEPFTLYLFRAQGMAETHGVEDGELCSIAHSYKLAGLDDIPDGMLTRVTYVKDVEVGRPQPMKDYRIQTRELPAARK
jgi:hypothetical protein